MSERAPIKPEADGRLRALEVERSLNPSAAHLNTVIVHTVFIVTAQRKKSNYASADRVPIVAAFGAEFGNLCTVPQQGGVKKVQFGGAKLTEGG